MHAAEMKQRKEGSVQKMRAALKDKEKAEKVLGKVTAQVETLADAQFTIGRVRERVRELDAEADANEAAMTKLNLQIDRTEEEMQCMSAAFAAFKKQHDALFVVRAWLYAGQVSYGIAARMAQREGKRASDADPLEAYCAYCALTLAPFLLHTGLRRNLQRF